MTEENEKSMSKPLSELVKELEDAGHKEELDAARVHVKEFLAKKEAQTSNKESYLKAVDKAFYIHASPHEWPTVEDIPLLCHSLMEANQLLRNAQILLEDLQTIFQSEDYKITTKTSLQDTIAALLISRVGMVVKDIDDKVGPCARKG